MPMEWLLPTDLQAFLIATTCCVTTESSLGDADTADARVWASRSATPGTTCRTAPFLHEPAAGRRRRLAGAPPRGRWASRVATVGELPGPSVRGVCSLTVPPSA